MMKAKFTPSIRIKALLWVLAALLLCWLRFPGFFTEANSRYIEPYGDGFKNYAVPEYHVAHDTAFSRYGGMNYPYGEHIVSSDGQPFMANILLGLKKQGLPTQHYVPEAIHAAMVLSVLLAVAALFILLVRLGVPHYFAGPATLGMVFLAPQMARMTAHYGLAQVAALPLLFLAFYHFRRAPGWGRSLVIALLLFVFSLFHFYFFALLGAVILLWHFFEPFVDGSAAISLRRRLGYLTVQFGLPLLFFVFWLFAGDSVTDRSDQPWGFFHYRSRPEGLLLSLAQPHWAWINRHILHLGAPEFEAINYLGIPAILGLALMTLHFLFKKSGGLSYEGAYVCILMAASSVLLLFSFGLPFTLPGFRDLFEWAGPVKQFRSIGRFSWPFYFASNIAAMVWFSRYRQKYIPLLLLILLGEAYFFQRKLDVQLDEVIGLEGGEELTELVGIRLADYQAILPIPYFHVGSDNFWWSPEGFILQKSLRLGIESGLPVTGVLSSRTSIGQSWEQMQFVSPPYREPTLLGKFPDQRPLLVLWDEQQYRLEPEKFAHLLPDLKPLYEEQRLKIYALEMESFKHRPAAKAGQIAAEMGAGASLGLPPDKVFFEDYDKEGNSEGYPDGKGMRMPIGKNFAVLDTTLTFARKDSTLSIEFWAFLKQDLAGRMNIRLTETNHGQTWQTKQHQVGGRTAIFDPTGWGLVDVSFVPKTDSCRLQVEFIQNEVRKLYFQWDELLIRPKSNHFYRRMGNYNWKDNLWFRKQE